jgi:hypothetical protein
MDRAMDRVRGSGKGPEQGPSAAYPGISYIFADYL